MITITALVLIPAAFSVFVLALAREVIPLFVEPDMPKIKRRRRRIRVRA